MAVQFHLKNIYSFLLRIHVHRFNIMSLLCDDTIIKYWPKTLNLDWYLELTVTVKTPRRSPSAVTLFIRARFYIINLISLFFKKEKGKSQIIICLILGGGFNSTESVYTHGYVTWRRHDPLKVFILMPLHRLSTCKENTEKSHLMQFERNATLDRAPNVSYCRDHASLFIFPPPYSNDY